MIRSFLAVPLPEDTAARLAMVQTTLPLPREVPPENMHLTLCFLDRQPDAVLEDLHQTLEALRMSGFEVRIEGLGFMGAAKQQLVCARVAPDPALMALQRKVETAARRAGAQIEARRFRPHITLGRFAPHEADMLRLERTVAEAAGLRLPAFTADRFTLFRSWLHKDGVEYEALADYPLLPPV